MTKQSHRHRVAVATGEANHDATAGVPALKADARDLLQTIVTAHLEQEIAPDRNVLYCATFQLAWNELCDYFGCEIHMPDEHPMVAVLNKRAITSMDLDPNSYIALAGINSDEFFLHAEQMLKGRFGPRASPILLDIARDQAPRNYWITYAYLFKELRFRYPFDRLPEPLFFGQSPVQCFGFGPPGRRSVVAGWALSQVRICDFVGEDDFIVSLSLESSEDRLYLAKVAPLARLDQTIESVMARIREPQFRHVVPRTMKVPLLNFDLMRSFTELLGKPLRLTNPDREEAPFVIARQRIRFRFDEKGAVLLSEALGAGGGLPDDPPKPKDLIFDRPFLIMLAREGTANPYFVLWVANAELLEPALNASRMR
ncbi:MAG TPA: hypothetical protein ENN81_09090 [Phycisphaerales bacterium]|nr:hypothetical protein [Phycisphaerales bacterium]